MELINWCLNNEKALIVITGISGSGKTTILNDIKKLNISKGTKFFEVDTYKVKEYTEYGFNNLTEKEILKKKAIDTFKADVIKTARNGANIVLDYPFNKEWQTFFDYLHIEYGYLILVVNCNDRTFEDIWSHKVSRDSDSSKRHKSLISKMYIDDNHYEETDELSDSNRSIEKGNYDTKYYNSIQGQITV